MNSAGNLLIVNENGAVASPVLPKEGLDVISETLKVNCAAISIAGNETPGSGSVCNNHGVLLHPDVTELEGEQIESILEIISSSRTMISSSYSKF